MTKARTLADNYAADINQVTADAPLTGGGTSGTVTVGIQDGTTAQKGAVQLEDSTASTSTTKASTPNSVKSAYDLANGAIAKSIVDAKGDLIVATGADTVSRLAVASTAGYLLSVDSAETTGLKWAAPGGGGPTLVGVSASATGTQSISNNTWTALTFDTEVFDTDGFHDNSTNNSRITIPSGKGGKYSVSVMWQPSSGSATGRRMVKIYLNGVASTFYFSETAPTSSTYPFVLFVGVLNLSAGDYIEAFVTQSSGGSDNIDKTVSFFNAIYLGA